ncbi:MAG: TIM barrel protein [Acidimicrobiales bacterium]
MKQQSDNPTVTPSTNRDLSRLRLGSAPDSWGVWFANDPRQTTWRRFLDELVEAGYSWLEHGPYGFLPSDAHQLKDELDRRQLRMSGGAVCGGLHRPGGLEECLVETGLLAANLQFVGAEYLVFLPEGHRGGDDLGTVLQPYDLDAEQWRRLTTDMDELAKIVGEEFGLSLVFHPHADSHVDRQARVQRFLESTDPDRTNLCLDTGHIAYCGGDNIELIRKYPERIRYVHLKQTDPEIVKRVNENGWSFAKAVREGVMVEPPAGVPEMEPVLGELALLDTDLFAIVEHDLYPCAPEVPLPIASRTRRYFSRCGLSARP